MKRRGTTESVECPQRGSLGRKLACKRGQMTVELCVVLPVIIAIAAILVNVMTFFGECAEFDRAARNSVRLCSTSLGDGADASSVSGDIVAMISEEMSYGKGDASGASVGNVACVASGSLKGGYITYSLRYSYSPTLFGLPLRGSIFGVSMPEIAHTVQMAVDPYTPGKWLTSGAG